ncbi:MAG: hypothetical protein WBD20_18835, partial [Pirellulaceae bacterium]
PEQLQASNRSSESVSVQVQEADQYLVELKLLNSSRIFVHPSTLIGNRTPARVSGGGLTF